MPAGRAKRPCLGLPGRPCREKIRGASRCPDCAREHERARTEARQTSEPWRFLYGLREWASARSERLRIDRRRCADCGSRLTLSVDHETPLWKLWKMYDGERTPLRFAEAACDVSKLRTRCGSCHSTIEAARRRGEA